MSRETNEEQPPVEEVTFIDELESLINRYSMENRSNTPDFILARYLLQCLNAYDEATKARSLWYSPPEAISSKDGLGGQK